MICRLLVTFNCYFDKKWVPRFILITDELNNNAIEYWSLEEDINYMRFKVEYCEEKNICKVKLEVEDSWKWKKTKTADEMYNLEDNKITQWFDHYTNIRWRWLFLIIHKLVDNLYFKDADTWGLIVWIEKQLNVV